MDDIFQAFGDFQRSGEACGIHYEAPDLLAHLTSGLNPLDVLQERTGLSMSELASQLADLELEGWVERVAGGYLKRQVSEA